MSAQPTPQEQLGQVVQQIAQVAINRYEAYEQMKKLDAHLGLLRDQVIQLNQQIQQQAQKPPE